MRPHPLRKCMLLAATAMFAGCGEPEAPPESGDGGDRGRQLGIEDMHSGALPAQAAAMQLLARLRARVVDGSALRDESWGHDVAQLQGLLWPEPLDAEALA